jgi:hypothetical protein
LASVACAPSRYARQTSRDLALGHVWLNDLMQLAQRPAWRKIGVDHAGQRGDARRHQQRRRHAFPGHIAHGHRQPAGPTPVVAIEIAANLPRRVGGPGNLKRRVGRRLARQQAALHSAGDLELAQRVVEHDRRAIGVHAAQHQVVEIDLRTAGTLDQPKHATLRAAAGQRHQDQQLARCEPPRRRERRGRAAPLPPDAATIDILGCQIAIGRLLGY